MAEAKALAEPGKMQVSMGIKTAYSVLMFLGLLLFGITLIREPERAWHGYLVGYFVVLSLSLGGLFFTAIQHMTKAGWSVNVRRFAEALTSFLPIAFVGGIVLLVFGADHLYSWLSPEVLANDALVAKKVSYLNRPFFWIRTVLFFGAWLVFAKLLVGSSLKQDQDGAVSHTEKSVGISVAFVLIFALSYSFFSVDMMMSLEPHWFSTIFGVYCFAGLFQTTMAVMILMITHFMKNGQLKGYVDENHLHDLGKFLFAFTVFWAYIAFSQYMLIWYANIPEETLFFKPRVAGSWVWVSVALILFKFIVPFFALLPRWAKRSPTHLVAVSILIIATQFLDMYWLVFPNFNSEKAIFSLPELGIFAGFMGLFIFSVTRFLSRHSIVPLKDPRREESLHHHVVY